MNNQKYLYGELNSKTSKPRYTGEETDSLSIVVDNDNMTIKGDVKWKDILGETSDKAYPGDLGSRNYSKILELTQALNSEIKRALAADNTLQTDVARLKETVESVSDFPVSKEDIAVLVESDNVLREQILSEVQRAIKAETTLLNRLTAEKENSEVVLEHLTKQVNTLQNEVSSLSEGSIVATDEEVKRAQSVEAALQKQINEEVNRSIDEDTKLNKKLDTVVETFTASSSDVNSKLVEEITTRQAEIEALQKLLDNEIVRSTTVDDKHDSHISKLNTDVYINKTEIASLSEKLEADIAEVRSYVEENLTADYSTLSNDLEVTKELTELNKRVIAQVSDRTQEQFEEQDKKIEKLSDIVSSNTELAQSAVDVNEEQAKLIDELSTGLQDLIAVTDDVDKEVKQNTANIQAVYNKAAKDADDLSEKTADLQDQIDQLSADITKHLDESCDYDEEIAAISEATTELAYAVSDIEEAQEKLDTQLVKTQSEVVRVEAATLAETDRAIDAESKLRTKVEQFEQDIASLTEKDAKNDVIITNIVEENNEQNERLDSLEQSSQEVNASTQTALDELNIKLIHEIDRSSKTDASVQGVLDVHEAKFTMLQGDVESLEKKQNTVQVGLLNITEDLFKLVDTDAELQSQVNMLSERISDETIRACNNETNLRKQIDANTQQIAQVQSSVENIVIPEVDLSVVDAKIQEETNRAIDAEQTLQQNIDNVSVNNGVTLDNHKSRIEELEKSVSVLDEAKVSNATVGDDNTYVYAADKQNSQKLVQVSVDNKPNSIVQRNENGAIVLPVEDILGDIPEEQKYAVPKKYVDDTATNIKQYVQDIFNSIRFIDGGNIEGNYLS